MPLPRIPQEHAALQRTVRAMRRRPRLMPGPSLEGHVGCCGHWSLLMPPEMSKARTQPTDDVERPPRSRNDPIFPTKIARTRLEMLRHARQTIMSNALENADKLVRLPSEPQRV